MASKTLSANSSYLLHVLYSLRKPSDLDRILWPVTPVRSSWVLNPWSWLSALADRRLTCFKGNMYVFDASLPTPTQYILYPLGSMAFFQMLIFAISFIKTKIWDLTLPVRIDKDNIRFQVSMQCPDRMQVGESLYILREGVDNVLMEFSRTTSNRTTGNVFQEDDKTLLSLLDTRYLNDPASGESSSRTG